MSLGGAFTNSSMAMITQSHALGQISTNVANINTTGYKQVDTNFKTLLSESTANFDFFGVKPVDYRRVSEQGGLLTTGRNLDVAIGGQGLFMVNQQADLSGETFYTRDGSFGARVAKETVGKVVAGNSYLSTQDGYYVMGWAADQAAVQAGTEPFPVNDTKTGTITGARALSPIQLNTRAEADGQATTAAVVRANINALATTTQSLGIPVWGPEVTTTAADGTTSSTWPRQNVSLEFTPVAGTQNSWTVAVSDPNGGTTGTATPAQVTFNGDGTLLSPDDGQLAVAVTYANGTTGTIAVDIDALTQVSGATQIRNLDTNGYKEGSLISTNIDASGVLSGTYSNGQTLPLYKLALTDFQANDHLEAIGKNLYRASDAAGESRIFSADSAASVGTTVTSGALEQSTVDLGDQFSKMITTQTAYSSSATVFRTCDEMSQTVSGLKR
ncbi:flagellar hook protein FlgE [Rhodospirillum rubrum]|uniref:Flagellar hook protein FlgE n=1 Tax=Rhodospirillum rubrum (strain ATCC 11170 / ATH 1.1.1 / DSM 467 / LMG 4362 / NCIMB 8255 / S1) TaxID=269796 RepID=Q2RRL4_RHORT|nr:flagellar hook-basal body complex protein [Rhodospirillum rubrum]ABC23231.1 Protein of unknown function DUF1078 [Rhodospirillum rubrum ATCC 11170]AEO48962.1 hypothetical protein F11_12490 [Rhodospirillum rubrum F11]MBK5954865.1 hypothetical protein [Rhodospirillum rubrum]QXG79207.1 flagellar hook-basal body complex protein [Rhodospirillum rubrum]HAP99864.1 flagellar hook-basal body complex protein [Rhodospirillum rubrum]